MNRSLAGWVSFVGSVACLVSCELEPARKAEADAKPVETAGFPGFIPAKESGTLRTVPPDSVAARVFSRLDTNKNGSLDVNEVPLALTAFFQSRGPSTLPLSRERFLPMWAEIQRRVDDASTDDRQQFIIWDSNGDGILDVQELAASRHADMLRRRLDLNGDGIVTLSEVEQLQLPSRYWLPLRGFYRVARDVRLLDRDHSGALSAAELGRDSFLINRLDVNGDSLLDRSEISSGGVAAREGPAEFDRYSWDTLFDRLDTSQRGWLQYGALGPLSSYAGLMDRDHDKQISRTEFHLFLNGIRDANPLTVKRDSSGISPPARGLP